MKNLNYYSALVLGCFFFIATSCSNSESEVIPKSSQNSEIVSDAPSDYNESEEKLGSKIALESSQKSVANVSFTTSPSANSWTNGSSGTLNLSCAKFEGGLKASVLRIENGNKITVRIQRTDGKTFGSAGTGYMKAVNPCGSIAGNSSWSNTSFYYIDVAFWATFTTGNVYFYPTISLNNGQRFHANPILVTANTNSANFSATSITLKSSTSVYATSQNAFNGYNGQCTWYVYARIQELVAAGNLSQATGTTIKNAFWGKSNRHAKNWPSFIGGTWYNTNTAALPANMRKKGLIVVWAAGDYGHVGFVESVSADKKSYVVSEFNYNSDEKYRTKEYYFDGGSDKVLGTYPRFYELAVIK